MRRDRLASVLACALATGISTVMITGVPVGADDKTNAARCVKYDQKTRDSSIDVSLTSSCKVDLECSVSWTLTCGGSKDKHKAGKVFPLIAGDTAVATASAAQCGEEGWSIRAIKWSCRTTDPAAD